MSVGNRPTKRQKYGEGEGDEEEGTMGRQQQQRRRWQAIAEATLRRQQYRTAGGDKAGDCGFAYPLLVYWNGSLSLSPCPPSPALTLSLLTETVSPRSRPCPRLSRTFSSPPGAHLFAVLPSTQSSRPSEPASPPPPAISSPLRSSSPPPPRPRPSSSFALYLSVYLCPSSSSPSRYPARRPSATYTKPTSPWLLLRDTR